MFKKKLLSLAVLSAMTFSLAAALPAGAQPAGASQVGINKILDSPELSAIAQQSYGEPDAGGAPKSSIQIIIVTIINTVLGLLGVIFLVLIIYAGFLWMTAGGNDEQVGKAKGLLTNAIIGVVIIVAAYAISYFVLNAILPN